jgi:RHS repeat-associated protein
MTTIPKPADPTQSFTATYDAWNRLIRVEEGANKVAEYEYDGAKRRTIKKTYVSGELNETRHFYYTDPSRWQVVEERVGTSTSADRQFVWGLRYVDELILRDRDTNSDGTLDERLYGMQDANWNVTSMANGTSVVQERFSYHPYGTPVVLTASFGAREASDFDWETMFGGYWWDKTGMLFQVRNRTYLPYTGWLSRDPFGYSERSWSLYEYVASSPTSSVDPSGEVFHITIIMIIGFTSWVALCATCAHYILEIKKKGRKLSDWERFWHDISCYLCLALPLLFICKRIMIKWPMDTWGRPTHLWLTFTKLSPTYR